MFGSVKWVLEIVRFWNPNLLWWRSFGRFFKHSIFHSGFGRLRWSDLHKLRSSRRFFTRAQATTLINLTKQITALPTYSKAYSRCVSSPPELTQHHAKLWLTTRHPTQDGPKVCVVLLGPLLVVPARLKLQHKAFTAHTLSHLGAI